MASPQKENGFTPVANEIMEKLVSAGLNGTELAVVLHILRKTYGYQKKEDEISISQFLLAIPASKQTICTALNNLQLVKIIRLVKKGNSLSHSNMWAFNKDYDSWQLVKKTRLVKISRRTSQENLTQLVKKTRHTKERLNKYTKEIMQQSCETTFSLKEKLDEMYKSNDKRMPIIACYWTFKGIKFDNKEQYASGITRELRASALLTGYTKEKVKEVMIWLNSRADFKWTLETVHKYIDEDLTKIISKNKDVEKEDEKKFWEKYKIGSNTIGKI